MFRYICMISMFFIIMSFTINEAVEKEMLIAESRTVVLVEETKDDYNYGTANYLYTIDGDSYWASAGHVVKDKKAKYFIMIDDEDYPVKVYHHEFDDCDDCMDSGELCNCIDFAILITRDYDHGKIEPIVFNDDKVKVGDTVYIYSIFDGIDISTVIDVGKDRVKIDASGIDGTSGSFLYNMKGEVIGVLSSGMEGGFCAVHRWHEAWTTFYMIQDVKGNL